MRNRLVVVALVCAVLSAGQGVFAGGKKAVEPVDLAGLLGSAGAVAYAEKADYGGGIDRLCLGYDKDGNIVAGAAVRTTKTYKEAPAVVLVARDGEKFKIAAADMPGVDKFHGKSKDLAKKALSDITGKVFQGEKDAKGMTDAVTGATKYYQAIYVSYGLMASKIIAEIQAGPGWERKQIPGKENKGPAAADAPAAPAPAVVK